MAEKKVDRALYGIPTNFVLKHGEDGRLRLKIVVPPPPETSDCHGYHIELVSGKNYRFDDEGFLKWFDGVQKEQASILVPVKRVKGRDRRSRRQQLLPEAIAQAIRARLAAGERAADLAREYSTSEATISRIKSGKIHKSLLGEEEQRKEG